MADLEKRIEVGQETFIDVGLALAEIRDGELYKENFGTFEDYCKERWGWSRPRAYELMAASDAVRGMSAMADKPGAIAPVQNERQARELAKIKDPEVRAQVWQQAHE